MQLRIILLFGLFFISGSLPIALIGAEDEAAKIKRLTQELDFANDKLMSRLDKIENKMSNWLAGSFLVNVIFVNFFYYLTCDTEPVADAKAGAKQVVDPGKPESIQQDFVKESLLSTTVFVSKHKEILAFNGVAACCLYALLHNGPKNNR